MNSPSSGPLCDLWCQLQELQGRACLVCPTELSQDPAGALLCQLWQDLQLLQSSGQWYLELFSDSGTYSSSLTVASRALLCYSVI